MREHTSLFITYMRRTLWDHQENAKDNREKHSNKKKQKSDKQ